MWKARFTWATNWWRANSANFPEVKENQQLKTEEGRAEVLLTPGSSFGWARTAIPNDYEPADRHAAGTGFRLGGGRSGRYREGQFNHGCLPGCHGSHPEEGASTGSTPIPRNCGFMLGVAEVSADDQTIEAKEGHLITLDRTLAMRKFDRTTTDALNRWSERRAEYVSMAKRFGGQHSAQLSLWRW